ncbi:glycosyltransferase family 2 protein, partial [Bacteroides sp.]|uniref:glycosyltransferase family 2 protein n=1 Tax=Bacteroides sp. TaxID=29523 RepID=UPI003A92F74B
TLREGAITCLVEKAEKTQADMVVAPFFFSIEGRLENSLFFDFEELQGIDYLRYLLSWEAHWCVWSKFHLRALYEHDIERPNISLGEDIILSAQLLFYSKKVVCIHKEIVDYNFTPSSMSHPENFDDFKYEDFNGYVDWINNYVAKKGLLSKLRREMACFNLKTVLMRLHWNKIEDVDKRMKGVIADLKQFPDLQGILTRRERKIVAVYRFSSWLGYLNLKRYKKQEKL